MLRSITLFLAIVGFVSLAIMGSMSLDMLKGADIQAPRLSYPPTLLVSETASALASRMELPRTVLQTAAIWAGLYLTSIVLCRSLITNSRSTMVLLVSVLFVMITILLLRAVDLLVVIAYLPALLVLLALWMRDTTDQVT